MKEIELSLSKNENRPVIRLYGRNTLIDTGALIPVFSFTEELLRTRFKNHNHEANYSPKHQIELSRVKNIKKRKQSYGR